MDLKKERTATIFFSLSLYPPPPPRPPSWAPGRARKRGLWGAGWGGGRAQTAGGGGCGGRAGRWGRRGRRIKGAEARGALMGVDEDGVEVSSKILERARRGTHTPPQRMRNFRRCVPTFPPTFPKLFFYASRGGVYVFPPLFAAFECQKSLENLWQNKSTSMKGRD